MGECSGIRRGVVHACRGKASAKDGRSLQMEEGLSMQHQPEEEERRLRSGLQHLLTKTAFDFCILVTRKAHEQAQGVKERGGVDNQHCALSLIRRLLGHQQHQQEEK